ncbi:MAG: bifunctional nuclease domain-containing protein, partial [Candidatus Omnitrophota bacterium]|nr:bifunctional nuclease domain-containing protein [Candidatus Omnitrophota bacterium]
NGIKKIDARPSDSIALALRSKAPIFIEEDVLEVVATSSE